MSLTEAEHHLVVTAAEGSGLSLSAWLAQAALSLVDRRVNAPLGLERQLLAELTQARTQAVRIGTNLNQAVRKLNETGRPPADLVRLALDATRATTRVRQAADAAADMFGVAP